MVNWNAKRKRQPVKLHVFNILFQEILCSSLFAQSAAMMMMMIELWYAVFQ
jgi:hypothetical protein